MIRTAMPEEVELLRKLEVRAGQQFAMVGMDEIANDEPPSPADLLDHISAGRAWVWVDPAGAVVAYLLLRKVDTGLHIDQLSVDPAHQRKGIGAALLEHAAHCGECEGLGRLTLCTFENVPWNAPYYERHGFRRLAPHEIGPELAAITRHESDLGLNRWPRICMERMPLRHEPR